MNRRLGLLVSAVVTVTIPGLLAVLAILGHEHAVAGTEVASATALGDESAVGPLPMAPASTNQAVRNSMAGVQRTSGLPVTVFSDVAASQQAYAMRLLAQAAAAGQATTYQGVEVTSQSGVDGTVTVVSQVWHQGGGLTLIRTTTERDAGRLLRHRGPLARRGLRRHRRPGNAAGQALRRRVPRGDGSASGMPARIVDVYRFDGSLAARFWLDTRTLVPLRREDFDSAGKLVSDELFTQVRFGSLTEQPTAAPAEAPALASSPESAWIRAGSPVTVVASLAKRGVRLPGGVLVGLPCTRRRGAGPGRAR